MRKIYPFHELRYLWSKLSFFFTDIDYIDINPNKEDIELLSRFANYAPNSIENLKGLKLSDQINLIKMFLDKYKDDPIVAISILEKQKINKDTILDSQTSLILELSVRKEIANDKHNKAGNILYKRKEDNGEILGLVSEIEENEDFFNI